MNKANKANTIKKEVPIIDKNAELKQKFLEELTDEKVAGNVTIAGRRRNIGRTTLYEWKAEDKEFSDKWDSAVKEAREVFAEEAEFALRNGVIKGNPTLIIFTLKNLKPEIWKDRMENTGKGGGPIEYLHKVSPQFAKILAELTGEQHGKSK